MSHMRRRHHIPSLVRPTRMTERGGRKTDLLTCPAKILKRRRTADEAGLSEHETRYGTEKIKRRPKREENSGSEGVIVSKPTPCIIRDHAAGRTEWTGASEWPMTGSSSMAVGNSGFPLVFDISELNEEQIMDYENEDHPNGIDHVQDRKWFFGQEVDLNSHACDRLQIVRSVDCETGLALSSLSQLSVSDPSDRNVDERRPVYLLIIFASFDSNRRFKYDAYVTRVNHRPNGLSGRNFGMNWMIKKLIDQFIKQAASNRRFVGNERWFVACCMVEAITHNPLIFIVNAYWRHQGRALAFRALRGTANQLITWSSRGPSWKQMASIPATDLHQRDTILESVDHNDDTSAIA